MIVIIPMLYYLRETRRASEKRMSDAVLTSTSTLGRRRLVAHPVAAKNPWRKPRVLQAVTIGYLLWSLLPVVIAVIFSFNAGRSRSTWQGFSMRWWTGDPFDSLFHDPALRTAMLQTFRLSIITVLIAVPLGTAVRDRHRPLARPPGARRRTS